MEFDVRKAASISGSLVAADMKEARLTKRQRLVVVQSIAFLVGRLRQVRKDSIEARMPAKRLDALQTRYEQEFLRSAIKAAVPKPKDSAVLGLFMEILLLKSAGKTWTEIQKAMLPRRIEVDALRKTYSRHFPAFAKQLVQRLLPYLPGLPQEKAIKFLITESKAKGGRPKRPS